jgi:hypothetical protein
MPQSNLKQPLVYAELVGFSMNRLFQNLVSEVTPASGATALGPVLSLSLLAIAFDAIH